MSIDKYCHSVILLKCFVGVIKPVDLTVPEQQELGYMALRDDFERVCRYLLLSAFTVNDSLSVSLCPF